MTNDSLCYMVWYTASFLSIEKGASQSSAVQSTGCNCLVDGAAKGFGILLTTRELCSLGKEVHAIDTRGHHK